MCKIKQTHFTHKLFFRLLVPDLAALHQVSSFQYISSHFGVPRTIASRMHSFQQRCKRHTFISVRSVRPFAASMTRSRFFNTFGAMDLSSLALPANPASLPSTTSAVVISVAGKVADIAVDYEKYAPPMTEQKPFMPPRKPQCSYRFSTLFMSLCSVLV